MPVVCRECREGLEHCHGAVVHHASHDIECTEDCAMPDGVHSFSIDCDAVGCTCTQTFVVTQVS